MSINILPIEIVRLYRIWNSILYRCEKPSNKQYKNYGGRGITICPEWKDFNKFCEDVGERPDKISHLDRIDNDKGYYKENCRWAIPKLNHRNKRNNTYYETHLGKMCQSQLIEYIGYTRKQFQRCIEKYGVQEFLKMFEKNLLPKKRINPDLQEIIGKKFNNFTVLKLDEDKSVGPRYFCICDCGKPNRISRYKLINLKTKYCKSCGKKGDRNPKRKKINIAQNILS